MKIICPDCQAEYNVSDDKITAGGAKGKCKCKCGSIFNLQRAVAPEQAVNQIKMCNKEIEAVDNAQVLAEHNKDECGNEVSDSAATYPKCGATVKGSKKTSIVYQYADVILIFTVVAIGILSVLFSRSEPAGSSGSSSPSVTYSRPHSVTYYVTNSSYGSGGRASLTYENGQGGTQQEGDVSIPWQKTFDMQSGSFLYISAQNKNYSGNITVRIAVDDNEFKRSDSEGEHAIATASGRLER